MNVLQKIDPSFDFSVLKKCKEFMLNPRKEEILLIHENSLNNDL